MSKSRIRIAPSELAAPGSGWTSARRAAKFVKQGRAVIEDGLLRFLRPAPGFYERLQAAVFEQSVAEGRQAAVFGKGLIFRCFS